MIERILDDCLIEIRAGRMTAAECLAKYPAVAAELAPLLQMATALDELPDVQPSPAFTRTTRARLLKLPAPARAARAQTTAAMPALRFGFAALLLVFVALFANTGIANAEASLPGEPLYAVKRANENIALFFAGDAARASQLHRTFAEKRLNEAEKLSIAGKPALSAQALGEYRNEIRAARAEIEKMDAAAQKDFVAELTRQQARLRALGAPRELLQEIEPLITSSPKTPQPSAPTPTPAIALPTNTVSAPPTPAIITPSATLPAVTPPAILPAVPTVVPIPNTNPPAPPAPSVVPSIPNTNPPVPPAIITPPLALPTLNIP